MKSIRINRLIEWKRLINQKKQWRDIRALADLQLIYMYPKSIRMLDYFVKHLDKIQDKDLEQKINFEKKSKLKLTEKEWAKAKNDICGACEAYYKLKLSMEEPFLCNLKLQEFYLENQMRKNLASQVKLNDGNLKKLLFDDHNQGYYRFQFNELHLMDVRQKDIRKQTIGLTGMNNNLDLFYHENKLRILCEKSSRSKYMLTKKLTPEEKEWIKQIPDHIKAYPQIELFTLTFQMIQNNCHDSYHELWKKANEANDQKKLSTTYLRSFYEYLIVHCTRQLNLGHTEFIKSYDQIFSFLLEEGILLDQGYLPAWQFNNYIKILTKCIFYEDDDRSTIIQKIETFINTNQHLLFSENKDSILKFNYAFLNYLKQNYDQAEKELLHLELHKDDLIKIEAKFLHLFILLETQNTDVLLPKIESLRNMISQKDWISKLNTQIRLKGITAIKRVQKVAPGRGRTEEYKKIKTDLEKSENFFGRDWLIYFLKRKTIGGQ